MPGAEWRTLLKTILIVDDDIHIGNMLEETLTREGYRILRAYSGTECLLVLDRARPDLVLLDLMLPGLEGEEVLPRLKGIPVIIVSARIDPNHKADLLLEGAADYVTKPFHTKELLARIAVQLRRPAASGEAPFLTWNGCTLDTAARTVAVNQKEIRLTRTEYAILKLLMQNPNQVITKSRLLECISTDTPDCTESSLKMHVSNLRRKLREADGKDYIEAVWGIGFILRAEPNA